MSRPLPALRPHNDDNSDSKMDRPLSVSSRLAQGQMAGHLPRSDGARSRRGGGEAQPWLLKPEAAAHLLQVSRSRIYELMAAQEIRSVQIGRSRRIPVAELRRWLDEQMA